VSLESHPQVAHIVPFSLGHQPGSLQETKPNLFRLLSFLAGPTVVQAVSNYLLQPTPGQGRSGHTQVNRLENLICLSATHHYQFGRGYFVLEPVGDPLAGLQPNGQLARYDVKFSWLPQYRSGHAGEYCIHSRPSFHSNKQGVAVPGENESENGSEGDGDEGDGDEGDGEESDDDEGGGEGGNEDGDEGGDEGGDEDGDEGGGVVEGESDNDGEEALVQLEGEGEWDLSQVLDAGVPMSEVGDPTLVGMQVHRLPGIIRREGLRRVGRRAPRNVATGFIFTLTTSDPLSYPLPHPDLLSIHAALMRVARAAGAAAFEEGEFDPRDEEEIEPQRDNGQEEEMSFALRRFLEGTVSPLSTGREF